MYAFKWLAHWLLLALALRQDRLPDAVAAARAMLEPEQQRLPDEVEEVLVAAVAAWDADDESAAQTSLETAVELAIQYGYL